MSAHEENSRPTLGWLQENLVGAIVSGSRSAAGNWLRFRLVAIDRGTATISLPVRRDMTNPYGNIHGGMMSLLIDEVIGWSVVSLEAPQHYTSLNLNVDFLYAAAEGQEITATATVIRQGKKIVHAECRVLNADKVLLAKATSNLIATGMQIQNS